MTIWIRNVEKVVEDARANFAAGSMTPLPPLPPRVTQSSRLPLKAEEIFRDDSAVANTTATEESPASRPRRATLLSRSPESPRASAEQPRQGPPTDANPPERKAKAKSALNLSRPITPLTTLQFELERKDAPLRSPKRLSAVLDPNVFFDECSAPEGSYEPTEQRNTLITSPDSERLTPSLGPDREVESSYDRLLMASSGVKRLGKGYQSNIVTSNIVDVPVSAFKRNPKLFHSARRGILPPQETPRKSVSVDELGALSATQASATSESRREDGSNTLKLMRRAFKAITGGSVSRRLSKAG
ncbi:hypothetical protein K439DRAFT_1412806 [Ramaria rubella]|nr:hypothetical protein K439DRAFT_1412806 [Ramaria rubella]